MYANGTADPTLVEQVENAVKEEVILVKELNEVASKHPYYKFVPFPLLPLKNKPFASRLT